jgi:hypothetical protein
MISDVLFEAETQIADYFETLPHVYTGKLRTQLQKLQREMKAVRMLPGMDAEPVGRRVGRKGCKVTRAFIAELHKIGPSQYGEFTGVKTKVQAARRAAAKYIKDNKLPLHTYIVSNDDGSQSFYVVGK